MTTLPEPYYQDASCTIYNADCKIILPLLEPVDLVLTDPPYGTVDGKGKVHKQGSELVVFNPGEWDTSLPTEWINDALKVLKDGCWMAVFTDNLSVKTVWDEVEKAGGNCKQTFYWIKTNPPPQPRKNFCSGVETAVVATKGAVKIWQGGGWTLNYYKEPLVTDKSERTTHPTQKPVNLMLHLAKTLCISGTILDPFMGSGTTLVAAKALGLKAIGIEREEKYCQIAVERLRQESLFSIMGGAQ